MGNLLTKTSSGEATPRTQVGYWQLIRNLSYKHDELAIFRRFGDLAQFDLTVYEVEINNRWQHLLKSGMMPKSSTQDFGASMGDGISPAVFSSASRLRDLHQGGDHSLHEQWKAEFRLILHEYYDAMIRVHRVVNLPAAEPRHIETIRDSFEEKSLHIADEDQVKYGEDMLDDLVALKPDPYHDPISRFIAQKVLRKFPKAWGGVFGQEDMPLHGFKKYSVAPIQALGPALLNSSAALYLAGTTIGLYHTESMTTRLILIAVFGLIHALFLGIFQTRSIEAITGISAFAAVQVIFVSADASNPSAPGVH